MTIYCPARMYGGGRGPTTPRAQGDRFREEEKTMLGSVVVYFGLIIAGAGLVLAIHPIERTGIGTRGRALAVFGAGVLLTAIGLVAPAGESRVASRQSRLDEFVPTWQFH